MDLLDLKKKKICEKGFLTLPILHRKKFQENHEGLLQYCSQSSLQSPCSTNLKKVKRNMYFQRISRAIIVLHTQEMLSIIGFVPLKKTKTKRREKEIQIIGLLSL